MGIVAHAAHVNVARNKQVKLSKETLKQIIKEELENEPSASSDVEMLEACKNLLISLSGRYKSANDALPLLRALIKDLSK